MAVNLRDYQATAIAEVRTAMRSHRRVLLESATGSGKTVMFASVTQQVAANGKRIIILCHRIELVHQICAALTREGVRHGVIAPGYPESGAAVQVAMVMTLAGRLDRIPRPDLLVVDEAHHAVAGSYLKILERWAGMFVLGVTATPCRLDRKGLGDVFDVMVHGPSMDELMSRGYLSRFRYFAPPVAADLSGIKVQAGDYKVSDMEKAMSGRAVFGDCLKHYKELLDGRPAIAFCVSVKHAEDTAAAFREAGWKAASVDGSMDADTRAHRIKSIGNGGLNVLTSCAIISEGTDIPVVAGAILLRPTLSVTVYLQQVGRVLRPKPDGSAAVIIDHVNNIKLGLPNERREWSLTSAPPQQTAVAVKSCPKCYLAFRPAKTCPGCGYEFPAAAPAKAAIVVDTALREVTAAAKAALPPLNAALRDARSADDLRAIGRARGYHWKWAERQIAFRGWGQEKRA